MSPASSLGREEIFGPVATVCPVRDLDEAFRIMDAHPNANATSIFTSSGRAAREFAHRASASMVGVNIGVAAPMAYFPFGGARDSFFGDLKAHGRDAFEFYTDQKVTMSRGNRPKSADPGNSPMTDAQIIELAKRHTLFEWSAQGAVQPIPVARASGVHFWTPDGTRYLDFNSQLMCVNIGHGDPRVIDAMKRQLDVLPYANPFMATEVRARLGAKLAEICPGDIDAFFFTNGGAEANENAMKIARWVTGRQKILAFYRSYHGGTAGAISATGDPRRWTEPPCPASCTC